MPTQRAARKTAPQAQATAATQPAAVKPAKTAAPAATPKAPKAAVSAAPAKASKPAKPGKAAKPVKAAPTPEVAKQEKAAKHGKAGKSHKDAAKDAAKEAPKPPKLRPRLVRDGFTMPEADFSLIGTLKARALAAARPVKKSELLRAGLQVLAGLDTPALVAALSRLEPVKTGRPSKSGH